ncbi:MAG: hypothetical protein ACI8XO_005148 [Verrucomicrobiales bacterium]|jgi:hypothetical protein
MRVCPNAWRESNAKRRSPPTFDPELRGAYRFLICNRALMELAEERGRTALMMAANGMHGLNAVAFAQQNGHPEAD